MALFSFKSNARQADFAFTNVNVITMEKEGVLKNRTVLIKDGRNIKIGKAAQLKSEEAVTVIDGTGKYLMPGISEMHAHIPGNQTVLTSWKKRSFCIFPMASR